MTTTYSDTWDLDSIYQGGSSSKTLADVLRGLKKDLSGCQEMIQGLGKSPDNSWKKAILELQRISVTLYESSNYTECLEAQDTSDALASQLTGKLDGLRAKLKSLEVLLETLWLGSTDEDWERFLEDDDLADIRFYLNEHRDLARKKMAPEKEILTGDLATDGYHAWGRLYDKLAGWLRVDFEDDGKSETISMGQLHNKMDSPDAEVRQRAFKKLEEAWTSVEDLSAMALNNQAGFRLTTYGYRKWDDVLYEPLRLNRMERATLDTMWSVIAENSPRLVKYLDLKAKLVGSEKMTWYNLSAPVAAQEKSFTFGEAADYITGQFSRFSDDMATFAGHAFQRRWIEAEDRAGKAAGGFCTDFPASEETRIFMTFGENFGSVSTLAHELGHAYHTWLLRKRPLWATIYPMTLAETASTFCETLIVDAALEEADNDEEKLTLLDKKLDEAATMMMNIRARFLFETSFFDARQDGPLTADRLSELMLEAQRTAYCNGLAEEGLHPHFWASKLHFYITGYPFYNFPYVFGFLFSNGIYDRALQEGAGFAKKYQALLGDTGVMTCEQVARRHLGVDLTKPEFWQSSVDRALSHLDGFVDLATAKLGKA